MYQSGKAAKIAKEMHKYKIEVMGLSETRWISTGKTILATAEVALYSGHQEDDSPQTEGVAFMMTKEASKALISWEPINLRIITASFQTKQSKIKANLIQCYAPTYDAEESDKENFYFNTLNVILNQQKEKDLTILMGDFNAKVGYNNTGYGQTMGRHGIGQMNENGERFAELCAKQQMCHRRKYFCTQTHT
jgi:exonuclease III